MKNYNNKQKNLGNNMIIPNNSNGSVHRKNKILSNVYNVKRHNKPPKKGTLHQYLLSEHQEFVPNNPDQRTKYTFHPQFNIHDKVRENIKVEKHEKNINTKTDPISAEEAAILEKKKLTEILRVKKEKLEEFQKRVKQRLSKNIAMKRKEQLEKQKSEEEKIQAAREHQQRVKERFSRNIIVAPKEHGINRNLNEESHQKLSSTRFANGKPQDIQYKQGSSPSVINSPNDDPSFSISEGFNDLCPVDVSIPQNQSPHQPQYPFQSEENICDDSLHSIPQPLVKPHSNQIFQISEDDKYLQNLIQKVTVYIDREKIQIPPLCICGTDVFQKSYKCCNNCPFYKNPKSLAHALESLLYSYGIVVS